MEGLQIEERSVASLKPRPGNPRRHSKTQIDQIAASIKRFRFNNPVLIDNDDYVVAGHGRLAAARQLGMKTIPTLALRHMSEADIRAYAIAENRLGELSDWDDDLLRVELAFLSDLEIALDITVTGFEMPEIDALIGIPGPDSERADSDDGVPEPKGPIVTRPGDIWIFREHRLICADARAAASYTALMGADRADVVFSDAPYNVPISGHVSSAKRIRRREFEMGSGEMSPETFTSFLESVFSQLAAFSVDGAIHFQCMDWRHMAELQEAGRRVYSELKNVCVWAKTGAGMGSFYRSQHELIYVYKSGRASHINNVSLGRYGRNRSNVWTYAGVNGRGSRRRDLELHPTVKPVSLVSDAIRDCSHRGGLVLDPFGGSGTTLIACERTGRRGRVIELDPAYCDVIITRMHERLGITARLEATGQTFDEVRDTRSEATSANPESSSDGDSQ